jgi:hypothetical protein
MNDLDKYIYKTIYDNYFRDWDYNMKKDKGKKGKKKNKPQAVKSGKK